MGHPNLSDDLNEKIDSQNQGVFIKDLPSGTIVKVCTSNSIYLLRCLGGDQVEIQGNGNYFNNPQEVVIVGSTWGGSCLKEGWVGVGMYLEILRERVPGIPNLVLTSQIQSVSIIRREGESYRTLAGVLVILAATLLGSYAWLRSILK